MFLSLILTLSTNVRLKCSNRHIYLDYKSSSQRGYLICITKWKTISGLMLIIPWFMWNTATRWRYCKMADRMIKNYLYLFVLNRTEFAENATVSSVNISLDYCPLLSGLLSQLFHRLRGSQELVGRHTQSSNVQVVPWGQHNRQSWWQQVTFKHNVFSFDIVIYE